MATHSSILAWRIRMDRGAWRATVHGIAKSWTRLSSFTFTFMDMKLIALRGTLIKLKNVQSGCFSGGSVVKNLPAVQEMWVQLLGWEDLLEREMATHSSILAWEIPWMKEPGRLQSMGSQRVTHDSN